MDQFGEIGDSVLVLILLKAYLEIRIWVQVGFWEVIPGTTELEWESEVKR